MNIFKYKLNYGINHLSIPNASQFLDVQMQNGDITLWTLEPTDTAYSDRYILVCFTGEGHDLNTCDMYISTLQHGVLVYHVFEKL